MAQFKCEHCGKVNNEKPMANGVGLAVARAKGRRGGRPPLDAELVKTAEGRLRDGKEIGDIAKELHCSERTIRRVLQGKHKYSSYSAA